MCRRNNVEYRCHSMKTWHAILEEDCTSAKMTILTETNGARLLGNAQPRRLVTGHLITDITYSLNLKHFDWSSTGHV